MDKQSCFIIDETENKPEPKDPFSEVAANLEPPTYGQAPLFMVDRFLITTSHLHLMATHIHMAKGPVDRTDANNNS